MKVSRKDASRYVKLRKQFISAYGYYLHQSTSVRELEKVFLAQGVIDDFMIYPNLSRATLESRLADLLEADTQTPESLHKSKVFIRQRILETTLLIRQAETMHSKILSNEFRAINQELFGDIERSDFARILSTVLAGSSSRFSTADNSVLRSNIATLSSIVSPVAVKTKELINKHGVVRAARMLIHQTGMYRRGWRVIEDTTRVSSVVAPHSKQLVLGSSIISQPDVVKATALLMHEFTHVLRSKYKTAHKVDYGEQKDLSSFEEGLAHAIERISASRPLIPARYWRYLAIGLSWGIDNGIPRTGREVFDILVPLYAQYAKDTRPEHYIFGTVLRVWKGTPLTVAGGALTKDVRYVHGSLQVLALLSDKKLKPKEFRYLLTHKVK